MMKIGEFSKLSHLTVKALRFYEKEGLLIPASIDSWNGYRFYETSQLKSAAKIKSYRQLGFSINEIRDILNGKDTRSIFTEKAKALQTQKDDIEIRLSIINHILEEEEMKYQVTEKIIPAAIVYYAETVLNRYSDSIQWIPTVGEECRKLNPNLKCTEPPYEFCEYPDGEHKETDIQIRHSEAVVSRGVESENIKFREIPETKVISIFHKGAYDQIGEAYAYIMKYAEENGYEVSGLARECYIDGIWNKESVEDWLTEIQLPVK
ncbi:MULTISPECIES: MerR family transcriptional regulator [Anaerostipes]|uniref:MerR family transcriptional regulator n=1 Tax=Anaerostipes TaxID=207244 RepID=UPI0009531C3E|nr:MULTISPECIES: MerR family transcriptional regulator [Anaerostipes]MCI5623411.1 MerR family transcriptional regulator [Anaerostipes sp.]OLR58542.1 transcriptional regulator [Anaerostipes sp. 494a]